ncbi:MAG TPA: hypothetical protein VFN05_02225 [Actinomycetes bacterium]|nr:hypothetical protein [Actinomycetes bacterium]
MPAVAELPGVVAVDGVVVSTRKVLGVLQVVWSSWSTWPARTV